MKLTIAHQDGIWSVDWKGNKIISAGVDDQVLVWNSETYAQLASLPGHQLGVISVDISTNGQYACSSSLDQQVRIWNLQTFGLQQTIEAGPVEAWKVRFSPDARYIASGTHSGQIHTWITETGEKDRTMETRGKFAMSVCYVIIK